MKSRLETILLVDDDAISNFVTEETLRTQNLCRQLVTVTDGQQALAYLQEVLGQQPQKEKNVLVLLDLTMPVMDGFEFMQELQEKLLRQWVEIAVLTSSDYQRDMTLAEKYAIAGYLQKPVSGAEVSSLAHQHFEVVTA